MRTIRGEQRASSAPARIGRSVARDQVLGVERREPRDDDGDDEDRDSGPPRRGRSGAGTGSGGRPCRPCPRTDRGGRRSTAGAWDGPSGGRGEGAGKAFDRARRTARSPVTRFRPGTPTDGTGPHQRPGLVVRARTRLASVAAAGEAPGADLQPIRRGRSGSRRASQTARVRPHATSAVKKAAAPTAWCRTRARARRRPPGPTTGRTSCDVRIARATSCRRPPRRVNGVGIVRPGPPAVQPDPLAMAWRDHRLVRPQRGRGGRSRLRPRRRGDRCCRRTRGDRQAALPTRR
jgi:hypothetical protein